MFLQRQKGKNVKTLVTDGDRRLLASRESLGRRLTYPRPHRPVVPVLVYGRTSWLLGLGKVDRRLRYSYSLDGSLPEDRFVKHVVLFMSSTLDISTSGPFVLLRREAPKKGGVNYLILKCLINKRGVMWGLCGTGDCRERLRRKKEEWGRLDSGNGGQIKVIVNE